MEIAPDWTLVAQIINFSILFGVLRWKLFGPVMKILEDREKKIKSDLEEAEQKKEEAMRLKKEYEDKLKDAANEAQRRIQDAVAQGDKLKAELMEKGRQEVLRMKKEGQAQIALEREKTALELRREVSGLAVKIASKLLEKNIDEASNRILISEFIGEMN